MQSLKTFWGRRMAYVSMKTKSGSRLMWNMIVHHQSPCVEPRISLLSNRAATSLWYFRKQEIRYQHYLCLLVQVTETFNSWPQWLRSDFLENRLYDLVYSNFICNPEEFVANYTYSWKKSKVWITVTIKWIAPIL